MPTYTYKCEKCQKTHEIFQQLSEAHLSKCPVCGSVKFQRVITAPMLKSKTSKRRSRGSVGDFGPEL
ncbi:MAG: zinc ribbon domain-containing protein [Verrucomicrobia bacterium]|nr:zinc ribbon domain-containing protein [Verrucomicrobiota bacterium]